MGAFGLDEGESLGALLSRGPVPPALAHLFTDEQDMVSHPTAAADLIKTAADVVASQLQASAP